MASRDITVHQPVFGVDPAHADEVWEMLVAADNTFVPPLSARDSTTQSPLESSGLVTQQGPQAYFLALQDQHLVVAHTASPQRKLAGFMSFRAAYALPVGALHVRYHHVTTVIVHPEFRGLGITKNMYDIVLTDAKMTQHGISTRTWSTNTAHIKVLKKLGFHTLQTIADDRGDGIDTVYFVKDV